MTRLRFDPSGDGFGKFMDPVEETVLKSLWIIGTSGATREKIMNEISKSKKTDFTDRNIIQALTKLRAKGLVESKIDRMSPPITIYWATMNEEETRYYLVSGMCSILKNAMPEELEEAKRRLGIAA